MSAGAAKLAAPAAAEESGWSPVDFVYCGRRWRGSDEGVSVLLALLDPATREPKEEFLIPQFKASKGMVVGGLYTGAKVSADRGTIRGHNNVTYDGLPGDMVRRMAWQSLDDQCAAQERAARMEKDDAKTREIERVMLPVRAAYAAALRRRDRAGAYAIEASVLAALRLPPNKAEGAGA